MKAMGGRTLRTALPESPRPAHDGLASLTARDLMTRPVFTLRQEMSVREAARALVRRGIHGAPVVDGRGRVAGVLSVTDLARYEGEREPDVVRETDYYRLVEASRMGDVPWGKGFHIEADRTPRVREIMTPSVIFVEEQTGLASILRTLRRHRIHRVMVLRNPGRILAGVITETDVLNVLRRLLNV